MESKLKSKLKVIELSIRSSHPKKSFYYWREIIKFANSQKGSYDLVHSFDWSSDPFEVLGWKIALIPCIVEKTNLSYSPLKWLLKLGSAKKIVCLSEAQVEQLSFFQKKVLKIPTGIDIERFEKTTSYDRAKFGLSTKHKVLISVAHLVPVKGHKELLYALSNVKSLVPHLKLIFAGEGSSEYTLKLKELSEELGVKKLVHFLGARNDIPSLMKMADGKILATRNEGRREAFGAALVEAMAAGLPVIATRSGGPEEIVEHGYTGWLINSYGIRPLESALVEFYNTPKDKLVKMGEKGAEIAKIRYNKNQMIKQYASLYRSILREKRI